MARQAQHRVDDGIYHVLNRGNCRMDIFEKSGDFQSFIKLLEEGRQRCSARLHLSITRARPFGDDSWTAQVAKRYGLESTLRDPWRPRKTPKKEA